MTTLINALRLTVVAVLLVLAFTLSLLFLAVVVAAGLLVWGYLWWRTRKLRGELRRQMSEAPPGGRVIEGELVREAKPEDLIER